MLTIPLALSCVAALLGGQQGPEDFPELNNADIPGAPQLGAPRLIMGETAPVVARHHGLAAPAVYDWDGDGNKDLLIGEFETGECWLRVYLNVGTDDAPRFSDEFQYAETTKKERLKVDSW